MKRFFTLTCVVFSVLFSQQILVGQTVEVGQTGTSYMTDAYVGVPNTAEFWITGKNLKGDITFTASSTDDPEATYEFTPAKVTKAQASEYTVAVKITPHKVGYNTYYIQPVSEGLTCNPLAISFPVFDTVPAITSVTTEPLSGDYYVGESYKREMYIEGNKYITDDVHFSIPEGSDVVELSTYKVSAKEVQAQYGYKLFVTFKPSKASANKDEKLSFPIVIKTKGMADHTTHAMSCHVKAAEPELTVTTGSYGKNVYVNTPFTKTIYVKGNAYLKSDITLTKKNATDNIVFSPATVKKEDAMTEDGAPVDVTITPSAITTDKTYFYFTVATEGFNQECNIWCWEVKDATPLVTLTVDNGGYIGADATKGEPFTVGFTAKANEFTTDSVYFFSDDAQITAFEPAAISADTAKVGKHIKVTIVPAKGSPSAYDKQSFVVKAKTKGAAQDAETVIQFVVLPVEEWEENTALEDVTIEKQAVKIIENGQLYILKDGVRYTILGTRIN